MLNDLVKEKFTIIDKVYAGVAGMDYRDLRRDRDFKKTVRHVISGSCYVNGGYGDRGYVYC